MQSFGRLTRGWRRCRLAVGRSQASGTWPVLQWAAEVAGLPVYMAEVHATASAVEFSWARWCHFRGTALSHGWTLRSRAGHPCESRDSLPVRWCGWGGLIASSAMAANRLGVPQLDAHALDATQRAQFDAAWPDALTKAGFDARSVTGKPPCEEGCKREDCRSWQRWSDAPTACHQAGIRKLGFDGVAVLGLKRRQRKTAAELVVVEANGAVHRGALADVAAEGPGSLIQLLGALQPPFAAEVPVDPTPVAAPAATIHSDKPTAATAAPPKEPTRVAFCRALIVIIALLLASALAAWHISIARRASKLQRTYLQMVEAYRTKYGCSPWDTDISSDVWSTSSSTPVGVVVEVGVAALTGSPLMGKLASVVPALSVGVGRSALAWARRKVKNALKSDRQRKMEQRIALAYNAWQETEAEHGRPAMLDVVVVLGAATLWWLCGP